ncbi:MAG: molybdenum cofactor biosynthesis protein MoaE [Cryobacterium sp.]|nr:molybdenum cofactor biosynthesis protein MoaE [Cryobacterium sp.]MCW5945205.1 molybdenum cofactor biosynthesis protein MoaE [Cryobacterium sp.]
MQRIWPEESTRSPGKSLQNCSGTKGLPVTFAIITDQPIETGPIDAAVQSRSSGAVVTFNGVVRDHDGGRDIRSLDYKSHPDAEKILRECCETVAAETGLLVAAAHRVGHLEIGDVALYAAVSSAHRGEAFEACKLLVDRIKSTVPIWKKQHFQNGESEWVGL